MQVHHQKLKKLSAAILELYRPTPAADFSHHVVKVLTGALSQGQCITYNELPTPAHNELVVVKNYEMEEAVGLYPVFEQYMLENPLVPLLFKMKDVPATRITDVVSKRDFQRTNIYNEYYRKLGLDYQMGCGFLARDARAISIAINRKESDFNEEERFLFDCLGPHVRQAFDLAHALEAAVRSAQALEQIVDQAGGGFISFDLNYRIHFISKAFEHVASSHFHCRPRVGHLLPEALRRCVLKLRGTTATGLQSVRTPLKIRLAEGDTIVLKLVSNVESALGYLIFEREKAIVSSQQLRPLGLSPRENDVVFWIVQDKTNWEIGKILGISPRTVEKHVEHVFTKLHLGSRPELVTKVRQSCL